MELIVFVSLLTLLRSFLSTVMFLLFIVPDYKVQNFEKFIRMGNNNHFFFFCSDFNKVRDLLSGIRAPNLEFSENRLVFENIPFRIRFSEV